MNKFYGILAAIFTASLLLAGCGDKSTSNNNTNPPTEQQIGPAGGVITVAGLFTLTVPQGALSTTVTFSVTEDDTPTPPSGTMGFVSACYDIGPSGTTFAIPAPLLLKYDPARLHGESETSVVIYTLGNTGWEPLETVPDTASNMAVTAITHLSSFAVMVDTGAAVVEGCYGVFRVTRNIMSFGQMVFRSDMYTARFDSNYAPCEPDILIRNDSVFCNGQRLVWGDSMQQYYYSETMNPAFIQLGGTYAFRVRANSLVPDLSSSITFPSLEPYITYPAMTDTLSRSGFTATWANPGSGMVRFVMMTETDSTQVAFETENDGSYTFTSAQLSSLPEGFYMLVMFYQNRVFINAPDWDSRSYIWASVISAVGFYMR